MERGRKPQTVDEYIAVATPQAKEQLERLRFAIQQAAPEAEEGISFEMPVYKQHGVVVYFGGFTKHVSLFPGPAAIAAFQEELTPYKTAGGTIRFPLNERMPITLIKKIVKYCLKANLAKERAKKEAKERAKKRSSGKSNAKSS